jgi:WD40 repeat protein
MYCAYCGTKNNKDDRFCVKCGKPLRKLVEVANASEKPPSSTIKSQINFSKYFGLAALVVILGAVIFGVYNIWLQPPEDSNLETISQNGIPQVEQPLVWMNFDEVTRLDSLGYRHVISPDGKYLAYQIDNNQIALWDMSSHQISKVLRGHSDGIISLLFSPDGKSLVSSAYDWSVILWNIQDGSIIHKWEVGDLCGVNFLDDGETLVTDCFETRSLYYWDTKSGEKKLDYFGWLTKSATIEFSPLENSLLQYGFATTYVHIYDRDYINELGTATFDSSSEVVSAAFLPDGMNYIAAFYDGKVGIWNINSDEPEWQIQYEGGNRVDKMVVSKNNLNPYAVFVTYEGVVDILDIPTKTIQTINHASYDSASISYDNKFLALVTDKNQIEIWTLADAALHQTISDLGDKIWQVLFSPLGKLMVVVVPAKNQTAIYQQK